MNERIQELAWSIGISDKNADGQICISNKYLLGEK